MIRDPIQLYFRDPDKKAKFFVFTTIAMVLTTILITIGMLIFILRLVRVI
ncbi:hypothetical protein [Methanobrevibacter filiformis]|uniref:Uncharacterized protein n=1 Tax=Methanobrevibacter filiformis TaxID=55758 RepID=A0A166CK22_9EURY|nr:hypothetical protein [Methanobrevibacter filiformis]KZX14937.1 hypothetical protein MBFIL_07600 [Methanobrevibacter filiformis]